MKKLSVLVFAMAAMIAFAMTATAADKEARQPDVYVNGKIVEFADQMAYITDEGRTLVPARGVFEAMSCTVDWDAENYVVTVSNENQKKDITLKIGDTNMVVKAGDNEATVVLDVPAQLMNNRTMIPLRAVSEALESVVVWNPGDYSVYISMAEKISIDQFPSFFPTGGSTNKNDETEIEEPSEEVEIKEEEKLVVGIETEAEDVNVGDEITVYINISNLPEDDELTVNAVSAMVEYDKAQFEFVVGSATVIDDKGEAVAFGIALENVNEENGTRLVFVDVNGANLSKDGGRILKMTFKVLDDNGGKITLANAYDSEMGYDTSVYLFGSDDFSIYYEGENMKLENTQIELK